MGIVSSVVNSLCKIGRADLLTLLGHHFQQQLGLGFQPFPVHLVLTDVIVNAADGQRHFDFLQDTATFRMPYATVLRLRETRCTT